MQNNTIVKYLGITENGILTILGIFKVDGTTRQVYETLRKDVDWEHNRPKGFIFHSDAFDDSGNTLHVAYVWESEEDLNDFLVAG